MPGPLGADAQVGFYFNGTNSDNTITLIDYLFGPRVEAPLQARCPLRRLPRRWPNPQQLPPACVLLHQRHRLATAGDAGADIRLGRKFALRPQLGFVFSNFAVAAAGPVGNYRWRAGVNLIYRF